MTLVYAHRGAAAEQPENTLPSFQRALELGADALETDVHLTRDGEVVTIHDPHGRRVAGVDRTIASSTLAEVRGWDAGLGFTDGAGARPFAARGYRIPTLRELLVELPKVRINVDLKDENPALVDRFIEVVREQGAETRVTGASFQRRTLKLLRARGFRGETSLARLEFLRVWLTPRALNRGRLPGDRAQIPTQVGPVPLSTARTVKRLQELGLKVDFWTVNEPELARHIVRIGADGIMTDDPARIVPAVRSAGG